MLRKKGKALLKENIYIQGEFLNRNQPRGFNMTSTDKGLLTIRIGLGLLFVLAGFGKLTGIMGPGISGFSGMVFGSVILAWIIALGEVLGGVALWLGYLTKWASAGLAIIILGALFKVHFPAFDAAAPMTVIMVLVHIVVLTSLLGLMFAGAGSYGMSKE